MANVEDGAKPSILLGNGFSRAWSNDIFNYANLLDAAQFDDRNDELHNLFLRCETYDFEAVMRTLVSAKTVLESYGGNDGLIKTIERDQQRLKDALITAISDTHPSRPSDVTSDQFTAARRYLSRFDQIFTVNYDLLFYWARNMGDLPPDNYLTDDGFRDGNKWRGHNTNQEAHFLHGGLHIFDRGSTIEKHTFSKTGTSIVDQVRNNLASGRFPLFVSEPTSDRKKARIEHNPYLNYCFRALRQVSGAFFIHGHSIDENDKHIFDQLKKSPVERFFVSIFGDEYSDENTRKKANARAYLESGISEVKFFDEQSAAIWA